VGFSPPSRISLDNKDNVYFLFDVQTEEVKSCGEGWKRVVTGGVCTWVESDVSASEGKALRVASMVAGRDDGCSASADRPP
jgi:hypothetical protein